MNKKWFVKGVASRFINIKYPRLPVRLVKFLDEYITQDMVLFEFGCGISSLYFDEKCNYFGVEHDRDWYDRVKVNGMYYAPDQYNYVNFPLKHGLGKADIVIADGAYRNQVLKNYKNYVKKGGIFILDDANRDEYNYWFLDKFYEHITFGGVRINTWGINSKGYLEGNITKLWMIK